MQTKNALQEIWSLLDSNPFLRANNASVWLTTAPPGYEYPGIMLTIIGGEDHRTAAGKYCEEFDLQVSCYGTSVDDVMTISHLVETALHDYKGLETDLMYCRRVSSGPLLSNREDSITEYVYITEYRVMART